MSALTLENVTYRYKNAQRAAVSGISHVFEEGKVYAIVGPSGSGKSTLLSLLAGLDLPTEGEVAFDGDSLAGLNLDRYRRESISMIFQAFHLFPLMTVMENVCFPMELCGVSPKDAKPRAAALLEGVGITKEQMGRFPSKLSGGSVWRLPGALLRMRKSYWVMSRPATWTARIPRISLIFYAALRTRKGIVSSLSRMTWKWPKRLTRRCGCVTGNCGQDK